MSYDPKICWHFCVLELDLWPFNVRNAAERQTDRRGTLLIITWSKSFTSSNDQKNRLGLLSAVELKRKNDISIWRPWPWPVKVKNIGYWSNRATVEHFGLCLKQVGLFWETHGPHSPTDRHTHARVMRPKTVAVRRVVTGNGGGIK